MQRSMYLLLALAAIPVSAAALYAQNGYPANSGAPSYTQSQAAPIERVAPPQNFAANDQPGAQDTQVVNSRPAQGVLIRYEADSSVQIISATAQRTEIRVNRGIANVDVHDPAAHSLILVDLPGGQAQLLKNGLYTFNAETNTVRVMLGEAYAFPSNVSGSKRIEVKGNHQVVFAGSDIRSTDFDDYQASADLLPTPGGSSPGNAFDGTSYYGGPYGYYGYPYWAWDYPYGWWPGYGWGGMGFYGGGILRGGRYPGGGGGRGGGGRGGGGRR